MVLIVIWYVAMVFDTNMLDFESWIYTNSYKTMHPYKVNRINEYSRKTHTSM